jgi:hypothetical protein
MVSIAAGDEGQRQPTARDRGRRRAAGIYGSIITAAIIAAASGLPTAALAVSVLVSLVVYWLAEGYAELLGEQATDGKLPTRARVRAALAGTWPMVSACYLPLIALLLARAAGASPLAAANWGLAVAIAMLTVHGWLAGRSARLRGWQQLAATSVAALLGIAMILLKNLVLLHLH